MKKKVSISQLKLGMYVAELDRPWLESPFLFQGFMIESAEQLATLRDCCQFVYVDEEKAAAGNTATKSEQSARLRLSDKPGSGSDKPITVITERTDLTGLGWQGRGTFRQDISKVLASRENLQQHVGKLLEDVRFGRSVDTREARVLVQELVSVVVANAAAALWLTNLENKHAYTAEHGLNVCILSIVFGFHLGLSKDSLEELAIGALLHDLGKMRTPLSILDKPGLLTEDEFDIMKKHPGDGFNILRKHKDISDQTLEIVQLHHERISGQGYPYGLRGDEIPLHVRLVAVADVYDDITSNRVYHEGIPAHTGLNMMFHWAPRDFGEDLIQEFIRCIGIYPIGSLVELNSGSLGIVMSTNPASRLRPIVMLIRDADGRTYARRPLINLASPAGREADSGWSIRRVVDSKEHGIDIGRIAEMEAGISSKA